MARCKWCSNKGIFLSLNQNGLCESCQTEIETEINKTQRMIRYSIRLIESTEKKEIKLSRCKDIIENARKLLKYERKCIPTIDPTPSKLIKEYITTHDSLIIKAMPDKVNEALLKAETVLKPYTNIYRINEALANLNFAKSVLSNHLNPKIIALINQKGGVGKTTSTINLGAGLAQSDKKVLLIDFDPQANLTDGLGIDEKELQASVYNLLKGEVTCEKVLIHRNDKLSLIPSNVYLAQAEKEFSSDPRNIYLLRNALKDLKGYDYILIDCPPSLGILTLNALAAAQEVIIPLQPEYYALKGIRKLFDIIEFVKEKRNKKLTIMGIIGTRYDKRKILHMEVYDKVCESLGNNIFYTVIRENISLAEASSYGKTIFEYKPKSHGAEDYLNLSKEVLEKSEKIVI